METHERETSFVRRVVASWGARSCPKAGHLTHYISDLLLIVGAVLYFQGLGYHVMCIKNLGGCSIYGSELLACWFAEWSRPGGHGRVQPRRRDHRPPLGPTPDTRHPTPDTQNPAPCTLHPAPYTRHPTPDTLNRTPHTLHPTHMCVCVYIYLYIYI